MWHDIYINFLYYSNHSIVHVKYHECKLGIQKLNRD